MTPREPDGVRHRVDRFGQRPLYYAARRRGVAVSGSVWSLLQDPDYEVRWDAEAAALCLLQSLPPGRTLWSGISRVPPGFALELVEGRPRVSFAGSATAPVLATGDGAGAAVGLLRLLRGAVRLAASEDAACALSGGLDSAALLALMSESGGTPRAFSLVDDACRTEELSMARELAARFRAEHVLVRVSECELPGLTERAVRACEEPLWNGRAVARWQFFRGVRAAGAEVLLSGTGADELLCGHPSGLRSLHERLERERALARPLAPGDLALPSPEVGPSLSERRRLALERVLPDSTLPPETRGSRAVGLDVRLPYLDDSLADWALALPIERLARGDVGKLPLRDALRPLLPASLCDGPKRAALCAPGGGDARAAREWRGLYAGWLTAPRLAKVGPFDPKAVADLLTTWERRGLSGRDAEDAVLLRLVSLAMLEEATRSRRERRVDLPRSPA
jgi:asparagine synthase (glutamine-hydrolysing)